MAIFTRVVSDNFWGRLSLRGGLGDAGLSETLKVGGFVPDDQVVLLSKREYDALLEDANSWRYGVSYRRGEG